MLMLSTLKNVDLHAGNGLGMASFPTLSRGFAFATILGLHWRFAELLFQKHRVGHSNSTANLDGQDLLDLDRKMGHLAVT